MKIPWVSRDIYERVCADHQALQDRLRAYEHQNDFLRQQLDEARADASRGREMVADWLAQQVLGRKIYNTGADLPSEAPAAELVDKMSQYGQNARSRAKRMEADFLNVYNAKVKAFRAPNQVVQEAPEVR